MKKLFAKTERPDVPRTPFKYERLESNQIRLFRLQPYGIAKPLSGSLETICLQDDNGSLSTRFEALSYFWGNEAAYRTLLLDNTSFSIKPNLEDALRELSKGKVERLLWIDAICINQADLSERNEQVRMMSKIYGQAERVIIWMGPRFTRGKNIAAEAIQGFAQRQRNGFDSQQLSTFLDNPHNRIETERHLGLFSDYTEAKAVDHTGGHWPCLVDFFDRPWWRRVWVRYVLRHSHYSFKFAGILCSTSCFSESSPNRTMVNTMTHKRQELAMSKQAIVQCGDRTMKWTDVAAICHWLKVWNPELDEKPRNWGTIIRSGAYSGEDLEYFRQTLNVKGEIEFETMLIHARNCESSNPRDKVYSILGLTGDTANDINVDYSSPISSVAIQAFRKQTSKSKSLDALIWSQNPSRQEAIPSWAPNLCSPFSIQPSRLKGKKSSLYAAAGYVQRKERYAFLEDGITLSIKGATIFDSIKYVLSVTPGSGHLTDAELNRVMSVWKPLVFKWLGTMEIEQKYERLMSALTCDRDIRSRRLPKRSDGLDWGTYFRVSHLSVGVRTEFEYLALAVRRSTFEGTTNGQTELSAWLKLCAESIGGKRIMMTSEGRIGLVPAETQPWDVVCLLGLDVPLVLRKIDVDTYIMIGEAYIHGAMDGEMLSYTQQVQDIKLQ